MTCILYPRREGNFLNRITSSFSPLTLRCPAVINSVEVLDYYNNCFARSLFHSGLICIRVHSFIDLNSSCLDLESNFNWELNRGFLLQCMQRQLSLKCKWVQYGNVGRNIDVPKASLYNGVTLQHVLVNNSSRAFTFRGNIAVTFYIKYLIETAL